MSAGEPQQAAEYARRWLLQAPNGTEQRQALDAVITAWLAAGKPDRALQDATMLIDHVPASRSLWRQLTRLALQAERPDLAARYARRLVGPKATTP